MAVTVMQLVIPTEVGDACTAGVMSGRYRYQVKGPESTEQKANILLMYQMASRSKPAKLIKKRCA